MKTTIIDGQEYEVKVSENNSSLILTPIKKEIPELEKLGFKTYTEDDERYVDGFDCHKEEIRWNFSYWKQLWQDGKFFPTTREADRFNARQKLICEAKLRGRVKYCEQYFLINEFDTDLEILTSTDEEKNVDNFNRGIYGYSKLNNSNCVIYKCFLN
jgi:hypothetical protein